MTLDPYRYDIWIEDALRGVVKRTLGELQQNGTWGEHHFYITFHTQAPGVTIPEHLVEQYPDEITIVLQREFWDLTINDTAFEVVLSFNDVRSNLVVPYSAISAFADPSVKFGLQLKMDGSADLAGGVFDDAGAQSDLIGGDAVTFGAETSGTEHLGAKSAEDEPKTGEVIALDAFRKK